jgi:hypothetical protein
METKRLKTSRGGRILHFESTLTCHNFLLVIVMRLDRLHYEVDERERGKKYKKVPFVFHLFLKFFFSLPFLSGVYIIQSDFDESWQTKKNNATGRFFL